jgi:hypothetical protein
MKDPMIGPELEKYIASLQAVPERNPARAAKTKAGFLAEAARMRAAVSKPADSRLNRKATFGKERIAMWKIAGALLLAVGLVAVGGGSGTVAAAQGSMPDDVLYPVKIWSEDVRLWAEGDSLAKMDLALEFADRRAEELVHQADSGLPMGEEVLDRLVEQDDLAMILAAQAGDAEAAAALDKVRERLENHERALEYVESGAGPSEDALLLQTRQMIRQRLEMLQGDLTDPLVRARIVEQVRARIDRQETTPAGPANQNGNGGPEQGPPSEPGSGGEGPQAEGTPEAGGENGMGKDGCPVSCDDQGAGGSGNKPNAKQTPSIEGCVCPTLVCPTKGGGNKQGGKP